MPKTSPQGAQSQPPSAAMRAPYAVDHDVHVLDRLNVLYKYRHVAISVLLLVVLASLLRTYTTTPMYRAQARILIDLEDERTEAVGMNSSSNQYLQDPEPYFQTQYRILTGRDLARRVVTRLNLAKVPEFNGAGPEPTRVSQILAKMREQIEAPVRNLLHRPAAQPHGAGTTTTEAELVDGFLSRVSVAPVKDSHLVDVLFVSADPAFATKAADALAEEYVQQNFESRRLNSAKSLEFLSTELVKQKAKVEDSERAMAQYREDQNALSLEDRQNIVVARLNQLNDAATRAKTQRVQKESLYNQIKSVSPTVASPDTIPSILQNPYIQSMKTRLADLQRDRTTLMERYGDKHPEVIKVNANIQDAQRQLQLEIAKAVEGIRNEYQSAVSEEKTLSQALEEQKSAAMDLNRKSVSYTVLERDAQSNRTVYEALLQREKELQVTSNGRGNNVRLMDHAELPGGPFTPDPSRDLMLAVMAGLALAVGCILGIDYLDDTIKTPEDVTRKLKLPFLGMVPKIKGEDHPLLSARVPHEFGEAFRSLRTALVFSNGSETTRVVMVTSSQPLEGKTTTACNMAIALAFGGARVLLIDADMRRPGVHRTLGLQNTMGLSHLLTGQATPRQAIQKLENPNLWVMTAGVIPPNPSELLASDRMKTLVKNAQNGPFDWVIIDTPPVLAVTDAVIISPLASGVAFVVGSEMTRRRVVERAIETLMTSKPHLMGVVLNRVDLARNRYYYSRYYGYKYKSYYATSTAA